MSINNTACGFAILVAAGCMPKEAEPLNADQVAHHKALLEGAEDNLDLLGDTVAESDKDFVLCDNPTLQTAIDRGIELLDNGQVYIISDEAMAQASAQRSDLTAYAHMADNENQQYILLTEAAYNGGNEFGALSMFMHEVAHLEDPENSEHSKEIQEIIESTNVEPDMDAIITYQDVPYEYSRLFQIQDSIVNHSVENTTVNAEEGDPAYWGNDNYENYDAFKNDYTYTLKQIDNAKTDPTSWATEFVGSMPKLWPDDMPTTNLGYYVYSDVSNQNAFIAAEHDLGLDGAALIRVLAQPSAEFIRERSVGYLKIVLENFQDNNPEYYEQYRAETNKEKAREIRLPKWR
ncbi:MAG: hypothetical protein WCV88_05995 [Patescibacteria group bacterium]